jgi:molybdenum cofactor biosynthesis enzyme
VYDMLKGLSHDIVIARTELVHKAGGRRTVWR